MSEAAPRVVLDCMIFLQGVGRHRGLSRRCLELIDAGALELWLSPEILLEVDEVLNRPLVRSKFPLLSTESSRSFLRSLSARAQLVLGVSKSFALPRDPDDEMYVDLAIAAGARYLVTWNERHLTYLMQRDTPEGCDFCGRYPTLTILDLTALRDAL